MRRNARGSHLHGTRSSKQLSESTWSDFEELFSANNGVWGGCWCMFFHKLGAFDSKDYVRNKRAKRSLVKEGRAHGTIVYCGEDPVGWCQFGPKEELPRVDAKKRYSPTDSDPWRITCLFISRYHRKMGFAELAVRDSVKAIEDLRGKVIEAYPVDGRLSASLLWTGTPELFEEAGFSRVAPLGKNSWVYSLRTR